MSKKKNANSAIVTTKLSENPEVLAKVLKADPTYVPPTDPKPVASPEETSDPKPAPATPTTKPAETKKTKTQGIFQITSKFDPTVILKGSSSQIEICTRDYMNWCLKNKAPKTLQAEYDKQHALNAKLTPAEIFEVTILKACPTTTDLKNAKADFGLLPSSKPAEPVEPKKVSPLMMYATCRANTKFATEFSENPEITPEVKEMWVKVADLLIQAEAILEILTAPGLKANPAV